MRLLLICLLILFLSHASHGSEQQLLYVDLVWTIETGYYYDSIEQAQAAVETLNSVGHVAHILAMSSETPTSYRLYIQSRFSDRGSAEDFVAQLHDKGMTEAAVFNQIGRVESPRSWLDSLLRDGELPAEARQAFSELLRYTTYVGPFDSSTEADSAVATLCANGIEAHVATHDLVGLHVNCGEFVEMEGAQTLRDRVRKMGFGSSFITIGIPFDENFRYDQSNSARLREMAAIRQAEWTSGPGFEFQLGLLVQDDLAERFPYTVSFVWVGRFEEEDEAIEVASRLNGSGHYGVPVRKGKEWTVFTSDWTRESEARKQVETLRAEGFDAYSTGQGYRSPSDVASLMSR